ncbi:MAG: LysR substrate-binding domain-containing protein [Acidobacteriota bacterium]
MEPSLRQLRIVEAVAREGGAGAAARRLRLTQPAVSHALRKLEQELKIELFERDGRGMRATAAGRRVAEVARRVLADLEGLRLDLEQLGTDRRGTLRVATECYTCYRWLPSLIGRFRSQFPGFEIEIVPEAARAPYQALREAEVELVITHSQRHDADVTRRSLFRDELLVILPAEHPLAAKPFLEPVDFAGQPVILHTDPENSELMRRFLAPADVRPQRCMALQLTAAVLEAVRAGLGLSVLAHWVAGSELAKGDLVGRSLGPTGLFRDWSITTLANQAERPVIVAFARLVENELKLLARESRPAAVGA